MNLTLFDLDGTLLATDSDHAFNEFMVRLGWADAEAHRRANDAFYQQYQAGTLDTSVAPAVPPGSPAPPALFMRPCRKSKPGTILAKSGVDMAAYGGGGGDAHCATPFPTLR